MKLLIVQNEKPSAFKKIREKISLVISFCVLLTLFFTFDVSAQNTIRVKGHVVNENGQPVQRASVTVKGISSGVTTDDNGNFEITAPANGTLVISSVNFATQEIKVNNRQTLTITLVSSTVTESEVIVVGYGTQRRKDVTGSVASITGAVLKQVPAPNLISQLKGRVAGV